MRWLNSEAPRLRHDTSVVAAGGPTFGGVEAEDWSSADFPIHFGASVNFPMAGNLRLGKSSGSTTFRN